MCEPGNKITFSVLTSLAAFCLSANLLERVMKRETFNLIRPFVLKAVGLIVALVILPPAVILGVLRKGWSGFFSVPFRKLPPALLYDSQWGTHRYGTGIQVSFAVSLPMPVRTNT